MKTTGQLERASFDPSGDRVAITLANDGVALVDLRDRSVKRLPGHAALFHPTRALLVLETESAIEVRDPESRAVLASMRGGLHPFDATGPFFGDDLVATAHDASLTLWDLRRGAPKFSARVVDEHATNGLWGYTSPVVGPRFLSFVRTRARPSDPSIGEAEAVLARVADGEWLAADLVSDGAATHLFVHDSQGHFDADDEALPRIMLITADDGHDVASALPSLRRRGLLQAFLRGDRL